MEKSLLWYKVLVDLYGGYIWWIYIEPVYEAVNMEDFRLSKIWNKIVYYF